MQVPREWAGTIGPRLGLAAGSGTFVVPPCQQFTMNWTMADPSDNPNNYLPPPIWNVLAVVDSSDSSGATWNIQGSYTGSWSGNPGTATTSDISLESTDKFTINSFTVTGQATAGACAAVMQPISIPLPQGCAAGTVVDTTTGKCVPPCSDGSAPAGGVCPPSKSKPPTTPSSTTSTSGGAVVAVVAGVVAVAGGLYFVLR